MNSLTNSHTPHTRISDAERARAIEALGSHFAEGRLDLAEYDERVATATAARTNSELNQLFTDLPALHAGAALMPMYSAAELQRVNTSGKKTKAGVVALTGIGAMALSIAYTQPLLLFLIPAVYVMLYVMKLGPAEWHAPSPRQLERQRLRALKMEQAVQQSHRKAIRREITDELTQSALRLASKKIKRF